MPLLFCDGMDAAIVGVAQRFNDYFVVYDRARAIAALQRGGLSRMDAEEYFEFNVVGAWVGDQTPCFLLEI